MNSVIITTVLTLGTFLAAFLVSLDYYRKKADEEVKLIG